MKKDEQIQINQAYITKNQLACLLQLTTRTIDRLMARGLPHYKIGNQRCRYKVHEIEQWLRANCKVVRRSY